MSVENVSDDILIGVLSLRYQHMRRRTHFYHRHLPCILAGWLRLIQL